MLDWILKTTSKIKDNKSEYNFHVKHEPEIIDSSSILTLTAFSSKKSNSTIPCHYRWFKIRNGLTSEVPTFKGNSYICEPSDVGSIIQVEITVTIVLSCRAQTESTVAQLNFNLGQLSSICC